MSPLGNVGLFAALSTEPALPAVVTPSGAERPKATPDVTVRCIWCAYEVDWTGNVIEAAPPATVTVMTERGERQLCAAHAARGTWERRARRVSRVA